MSPIGIRCFRYNWSTNDTGTRIKVSSLGSVAGSVIQATGRTDFEDGPWIGNQSEVGNSLQRVRTKPENRGGVDQVPPGADESPTC